MIAVYEPGPQLMRPMCSAGRAMYFNTETQFPSLQFDSIHVVAGGGASLFHRGALADCQICGWLYR